jgi:L-glutamine-phosphate cytidylyltransferase
MKAIILAAGEGKRLRPLTNDKPKCMVKLFDKSILETQIDIFHKCGITDISVVTGYKNELIKFPNITYFKNKNYSNTNMVETLFCAKEKLNEGVIISYGDIIFERNVLQKILNSKDDYSVVVDKNWEKYWKLRFDDPLNDAETLILDNNNYITEIGQKTIHLEKIESQYIGLIKFQNNAIDFVTNFYERMKKKSLSGKNPLNPKISFEKSFMTDFLQSLIKENCKIKAISINNGWLELDSISDYNIYKKKIKDGTIREFINLT